MHIPQLCISKSWSSLNATLSSIVLHKPKPHIRIVAQPHEEQVISLASNPFIITKVHLAHLRLCRDERGLVLTADGAAETLLQGAARLSFPNMTVPMLDKLHKHLEVPIVGRRPTSENALLLALIQHALPGIEIEVVRAIIARRNKKELEECSSELADPGVLELIAHIAAPEDVQDIRDYLKKANGKRGGETTASTGAGSSMDHLRAPQIPAIERGVLGGDEEVSVEEYRKYLPFVVGCTLIKEEMWHLRFKVTYKEKPEPPFTFSRCWDPTQEGSCRRAVLACLTWVWTEHEKLGFEPCPWNFEP